MTSRDIFLKKIDSKPPVPFRCVCVLLTLLPLEQSVRVMSDNIWKKIVNRKIVTSRVKQRLGDSTGFVSFMVKKKAS